MKRKFKLFATLASLCLSVALMAFGVYAATNVTYSVSSTVTFVSQVVGSFNWKVESVVIEADNEHSLPAGSRTGAAKNVSGNELNGSEAAALSDTMTEVAFNLAVQNGDTAYYYISFTNDSPTAAQVVASASELFGMTSAGVADSQFDVFAATATTEEAAKSAVDANSEGAAATAASNLRNGTGITVASVAGNQGTYVLAIKVVLKNAQTSLRTEDGQGSIKNNSIAVTLTVTPVAA